MTALISAFWGVLGSVLIWAVFRSLQMTWPTSYFALDDLLARRISTSPSRYLIFRFIPVLVFGTFVGIASERSGGTAPLALSTVAIIHVSLSTGKAATSELRRRPRRYTYIIYHFVVTVGIVVSCVLAVVATSVEAVRNMTPPVEDLRADLWTALIAASLAAAFIKRVEHSPVSEADFVRAARSKLDNDLIIYARTEAEQVHADSDLVESFLLVESIQRPSWFRTLERMVGTVENRLGVGSRRTYGVMQVPSSEPIDDRTSIERALEMRFKNIQVPENQWGSPDLDFVRRLAISVNPDGQFADHVVAVYEVISGQVEPPTP